MRCALVIALTLVLLPAAAAAQDAINLTFDTTTIGDKYAPRNIVAVWVEDDAGGFVKTIGRWSNSRTRHLVNWVAASGQDADAVSGATRSNHNASLTVNWDLKDRAGALVPDGSYSIHVEICEDNAADGNGTNALSSFTFVKDGQYRSEPGLIDGNVTNATLDYIAGESCIADSVCVQECAEDPDCDTGGEPPAPGPAPDPEPASPQSQSIVGSCAATGGKGHISWTFVLLGAAFAIRRRRRRR